MPSDQTERAPPSPVGDEDSGTSRPRILSRPLSIAMLAPCPFPTRQGTQVLIRHLAEALSRVGHEVHFVTYGYGEYEDEFSFHLHRASRVDAGLRSGPNLKKPAADAALVMTASRVAKMYHCDLWHVHNVEGLGLGALLKIQTALPLVYHAHNAMGPELPTYFRAHLAQAFASVLGEVLDRTLPKAADAVIAFDDDHRALHEVYGVDPQSLHVIPPGLDGAEIEGADPGHVRALEQSLGPGPWLLYAGNPDAYQNLGLLRDAWPMIRQERPDAKLLVATNHDPAAFAGELDPAAVGPGVYIRRFATLAELRAMFGLAEMGLSPRCLWTGAPIKVLNYLAVGLPVVACRSAARHILTPSCGLLVEGKPEAFAAGVLELLARPVGSLAERQRVFARYAIDNQVSQYERVYARVLGPPLAVDQ